MDYIPKDFVSELASDVLKTDFVFDDLNKVEETEGPIRPGYDSIELSELSIDNDKLYRIGELAQLLNLKTSTLRDWEKKFSKFLHVRRTQGGQRLYTGADLKTFSKIKERYDRGYTTNFIINYLKNGDNTVSKEILEDIQRQIDKIQFRINGILHDLEETDRFV